MSTETEADLANEAISQRDQAHKHPLEMHPRPERQTTQAHWSPKLVPARNPPPGEQHSAAMENIDVYLDDLI